MPYASVKKRYRGRNIQRAKQKFASLLEKGNYEDASRLGVLTGIVMAGAKKMFHAIRHANLVYTCWREMKNGKD